MATKSTRSSGSQPNVRGITQGVTLVDPKTGLPIDVVQDSGGIKRLAVDAQVSATIGQLQVNLDSDEDEVAVEDPDTGAHLRVETNGSINVNVDLNSDEDQVAVEDPDTGAHIRVETDGSINSNVEISAADGDNVFSVGSEDGTVNGTRHVIKVNSDLELVTREASTASTPTIYNVSVPLANTEVSQSLPSNTKKFLLKVRNNGSELKLAFTSGQSGTNYLSINKGATFVEDGIKVGSLTLYFQVNNANEVVEILAWS